MDAHAVRVSHIADQIRSYHSKKTPFRISHGSTNSTRPTSAASTISTAALSHILSFDSQRRTCLVEPNVAMDTLALATLEHNLIPPVVMEFPGITVGGGYSGTSGESSSFKHGFFNETLNWVELVLGDGKVVRASRHERADLFWGASGACGTLGVVTLVELRLVPAKQYVKVRYQPVSSIDEAVTKVRECTELAGIDYVDGILFSTDRGAIITGELTDAVTDEEQKLKVQTFTGPWDPWFYLHAHSHISAKSSSSFSSSTSTEPVPSHHTELVPIYDYLLRYDRAAFWVARHAFHYFYFPFNSWTRWFLDDFSRTRMLYKALHASGQSDRYFVQDLALPYDNAAEFIRWTTAETGIWPLWLCPLKGDAAESDLGGATEGRPSHTFHPLGQAPSGALSDMLNIGLWGEPFARHLRSSAAWVALNRALETTLTRLGGRKWLYAHSYYPQAEFDTIYVSGKGGWYDDLRRKYNASGLPTVWEKVARAGAEREQGWGNWIIGRWPIAGLYGIWSAIASGAYLEAKRVGWARSPGFSWTRVDEGKKDL